MRQILEPHLSNLYSVLIKIFIKLNCFSVIRYENFIISQFSHNTTFFLVFVFSHFNFLPLELPRFVAFKIFAFMVIDAKSIVHHIANRLINHKIEFTFFSMPYFILDPSICRWKLCGDRMIIHDSIMFLDIEIP